MIKTKMCRKHLSNLFIKRQILYRKEKGLTLFLLQKVFYDNGFSLIPLSKGSSPKAR
jgi:hypothetical protein